MKKIEDIISENIKKRRNELKMTQHELAEKANIGYTYIAQIEQGKKNPSLKTLYKISKSLDTPIGLLVSEEKEKYFTEKELEENLKKLNKKDVKLITEFVKTIVKERGI